MEQFLGKPDSFWIGLYTLTAIAGTGLLAITGWFIFWQLRLTTKALRFDGIRRMQEMVDSFREDRMKIYTSFPPDIVVSAAQFPLSPPGRAVSRRISPIEQSRLSLTEEQIKSLSQLNKEEIKLSKRVIGLLNDLGQLVEDGFIDRRVFLGKYHTMIIRLCHFLEAIRRQEEQIQGGSYGHRLLRMRHEAITFNTVCPKHRANGINIVTQAGTISIIASQKGTRLQRLCWCVQRFLFY